MNFKSRLSDYKQALGSKRSHRKRWDVATNKYIKGEKNMNRSFLELLEAEKRSVYNLKFFKDSAIDFLNKSETEADPEGRKACKRIAADYKERASKAEEELLQIRKEMKQYISFLQAL